MHGSSPVASATYMHLPLQFYHNSVPPTHHLLHVNYVANGGCLQVLGTGVAAMTQMDIGGIFAYPGVTLPQLLDETSDDLVFTTAQAALFGRLRRELAM